MNFQKTSLSHLDFPTTEVYSSKIFEGTVFDRLDSFSMKLPFGDRRDSYIFDRAFLSRKESIFSDANLYQENEPHFSLEDTNDRPSNNNLISNLSFSIKEISKFRF